MIFVKNRFRLFWGLLSSSLLHVHVFGVVGMMRSLLVMAVARAPLFLDPKFAGQMV